MEEPQVMLGAIREQILHFSGLEVEFVFQMVLF